MFIPGGGGGGGEARFLRALVCGVKVLCFLTWRVLKGVSCAEVKWKCPFSTGAAKLQTIRAVGEFFIMLLLLFTSVQVGFNYLSNHRQPVYYKNQGVLVPD